MMQLGEQKVELLYKKKLKIKAQKIWWMMNNIVSSL